MRMRLNRGIHVHNVIKYMHKLTLFFNKKRNGLYETKSHRTKSAENKQKRWRMWCMLQTMISSQKDRDDLKKKIKDSFSFILWKILRGWRWARANMDNFFCCCWSLTCETLDMIVFLGDLMSDKHVNFGHHHRIQICGFLHSTQSAFSIDKITKTRQTHTRTHSPKFH